MIAYCACCCERRRDVNLRDRDMFPPFFVYGFVFLVGLALGIMAGYWLAGR
jgi:hypothetical protein